MDKPSRSSFVGALEQLYALGALDDKGQLTPLGRKMSSFPIAPTFAKVLIQSEKYQCTKEAISIVAMLSVEPVFFAPHDKREEAGAAKKKFIDFDGDHVTLLNVLKAYEATESWCQDNFISFRSMKQIMDIRQQLVDFCKQNSIPPETSCGTEYEDLIKCFLNGFFKNVAIRQHDGSYQTLNRQQVWIHPSSVLFGQKAQAIMFVEWVHTTRHYLRHASRIQPQWLSQVAPHYYAKNSLSTLE